MSHKKTHTLATFCLTLSIAFMLPASAASKPGFDELIGYLGGNNEVKRSLARQFIPRRGAAAIPYVLPLLFHENAAVSWAANNVILDIANDVSVAGREMERAAITTALLEALAATNIQTQQFTLLRILPVLLPEGAEIQAITTLLYQENTRERARRALQESNTTEARAALRGALPTADPAFACALMDALDQCNDTASTPLITKKLEKGTPAEQAAAALALARTANPALTATYLALCKNIDINHRFDVEDATLQLADALVTAGGKWEAGMALYRDLLAQSENPAIQGAVLAGLGRYGDETALDIIMTAWSSDASGLLEGPAIAAIESLQDPAVADRLIAAYAQQPVPVKERLLGIMGRTRDLRYLPVIEGATDIAPAIRIDVLEQSRLPEAIPLLEVLAGSKDPASASAAARAISTMASTLRDQGDTTGAGRAYLAAYRIATDEETRTQALEGIKAYPVAEAYDELKRVLGDEGLLKLSLPVLSGMVRVLSEAKRTKEANELKTVLLANANDTATVQFLIQSGPVDGPPEDLARQLGFINQWQVVAPFTLTGAKDDGTPVLKEGVVDLNVRYGEGDDSVAWTPLNGGGAMAVVNLAARMPLEEVRAFAHATIHVAEAQKATLRLGTDDGVRAWLNGQKIHDNNADRGITLDEDQVPVSLQAGGNTLVLEIIQHGGGWAFCARLTEPNGVPLKFEQK